MRLQSQFKTGDARLLRKFMEAVDDKRTYVRALAVCLLAEGVHINSVCSQLSLERRTLYRWLNRFLVHHNADDLADKPRSGRPSHTTTISDKQILSVLDKDPRRFGYAQTTWTAGTLAHYFTKALHLQLSESTLRRRMKAMGLRYKLPQYVYEEKEPNRAQKKGQSSESCASGQSTP